MKKIAILGTGNLGLSIAKGLIDKKSFNTLYLTDHSTDELAYLNKDKNVTVTRDNILATKNSEVIIISVQPKDLYGILEEIKSEIIAEHLLISTVAGVKISEIQKIIGQDKSVVRVMPNIAISVGESMTCVCANDEVDKVKVELVMELFNKLGKSMLIPEEKMQAATVLCGSGIAFWMRLIRAATQGGVQLGFEAEVALEMAIQTCLGASNLLLKSGHHPEEEIDSVTTPGGCTIEGLNEMEHQGLSASFIGGLIAAYNKIHRIKD